MSIVELYKLFEINICESQDGSMMVNEKRLMNGMKRSDLRNLNG